MGACVLERVQCVRVTARQDQRFVLVLTCGEPRGGGGGEQMQKAPSIIICFWGHTHNTYIHTHTRTRTHTQTHTHTLLPSSSHTVAKAFRCHITVCFACAETDGGGSDLVFGVGGNAQRTLNERSTNAYLEQIPPQRTIKKKETYSS